MKYKAIIFDFGGVLLNIDFKLTHQAFFKLGVNNLDTTFSQTQQSGFFDSFEKGEISPSQFRKEIKQYLLSDISDRELDAAWNSMLLDIPSQRIEWILQLKKKYKCILLSNTNQIHYNYYRQALEDVHGYKIFSEIFDKTYFSHEIALRKPDNSIYNYVLKDLDLDASEIVFIDDTQKNIDAANALNWNTVLWEPKTLDAFYKENLDWSGLKKIFVNSLISIYDERELEQIFFIILEELYAVNRINYSLQKNERLGLNVLNDFSSLIIELKSNKPIQQILGFGYFLERKFKVSKEVLIPRQETEELVDLVLKRHSNDTLSILDIGTGSACIPITLKLEHSNFNLAAIDVSDKALEIAKENSKIHKVDIEFIKVNILDELNWMEINDKSLDVIISNPPYVRYLEKEKMHKNVSKFDPELALYVDDNKPLIFYDAISKFAAQKLKKQGTLYFEINEEFGTEVKDILIKNNFINVLVKKDLQDKDRFVYGNL